ncbi:glycosyltransferase family 61 protein [Candidatus Dependentiae bacterium]|nr:glycosyltransferase family 61 protein [Candidatus Dependentiae bacterium]
MIFFIVEFFLLLFVCNVYSIEFSLDKNIFNEKSWFKITPLTTILKKSPEVIYTQILDKVYFDYSKFLIAPQFPYQGYFDELFILTIPHGRVQGTFGHVFIDNMLSNEMARANRYDCLIAPKLEEHNFLKIPGKVAVIAQHGVGQYWGNYYHTLCEVFGRLAMLEIAGIEYDYLYIPIDKRFVKEILELWGIDLDKIISPSSEYFGIQAENLIIPSLVINTSVGHKHAGNFQHPTTLEYVRKKLLQAAKYKNIDTTDFSKKIFITRKDSYNGRRILNEDEIFALFEKSGFKRYSLCSLSVAEQIILFNNAEIVVSEQGSGLANILFCNQGTQIIEIFQTLIDNCFWWVSNVCRLNYVPIKTLDVDIDYFANWWDRGLGHLAEAGNNIIAVPLDEIQKCVKTL